MNHQLAQDTMQAAGFYNARPSQALIAPIGVRIEGQHITEVHTILLPA